MARTPHWKHPACSPRALENRISRLRNPPEATLLEKLNAIDKLISRGRLPKPDLPYDPAPLVRAEIERFEESLCRAKTRQGTPCKRKGLPNGRCRNHGGMSTGAKTPEGKRRALANLRQFRTQG